MMWLMSWQPYCIIDIGVDICVAILNHLKVPLLVGGVGFMKCIVLLDFSYQTWPTKQMFLLHIKVHM